MRSLEIAPRRWLDYEPPSLCGFDLGIGEALAATGIIGGLTDISGGAGLATLVGTGAATTELAAGVVPTLGATSLGLADIGTAASVGGTLISAKAGLDNAAYQEEVAKVQAQALRQKANEDTAASQRVAITRLRQTDLALSRTRALAASSGTDANSPDIINTEEGIAGQGQYNALSALYEGQTRGQSENYQAEIDLYKGKRIADAAPSAAAGTLLSGLSSFADRRLRRNYLLNQYGDTG